MDVPFHKAYITDEEITEVTGVLRSGWLTMGPKTVQFEDEFRRYIGSAHALSVNSCTAALHLALDAVGLQAGDEVIVPAMTFTATAAVVAYFNAVPVLVDVEPDTLNIDVSKIEEKITPRTKAIIPVDYAGQPADLDEIRALAQRRGLFVIEDAAHTLPSWYRGRKVGTLAHITCFSGYATKTLSMGEGGLLTTDNDAWAERIRLMRLHGMNRDAWKRYTKDGNWYYEVVEAGFKYNANDLSSALGLAQLRKLEFMWEKRRAVAAAYNEAFGTSDIPVMPPVIRRDRQTSWHLYVVKLDLSRLAIDRAAFIQELARRGVSSSVHFIPLYRHPAYRAMYGYEAASFPVSEWAYERIVSLPIFPSMTAAEITAVTEAVTAVAKENRR